MLMRYWLILVLGCSSAPVSYPEPPVVSKTEESQRATLQQLGKYVHSNTEQAGFANLIKLRGTPFGDEVAKKVEKHFGSIFEKCTFQWEVTFDHVLWSKGKDTLQITIDGLSSSQLELSLIHI